MGSGSSSSYSGAGGSQPYANTYHVVQKELNKDKKDPDIYNPSTGYFKNPTATNLENAEQNGSVYIGGNKANGQYTYVMDQNGEIIFGKRSNPNDSSKRAPHPTLIGGKDPLVQMAGMLDIRGGKIYSYDNQSGHYKPNPKSMKVADETFGKLPSTLFSKKKGGK